MINASDIANNFAKHFEKVCTPVTTDPNNRQHNKFETMRASYFSFSIDTREPIDVQVLSEFIDHMENGKAAGLDDLSCEHLKYCHPVAVIILCKFFNLFLLFEYLPRGSGLSYTVPIPKCDNRSRTVSVDDFSGISISPIMSKLFEMAILDRYCDYF